ncbi:MAG: undecaprenyldiphospho-muramoylpentapeptide beta-N-acetylglucosaminyltransferase [Syntrophobacterales bacterium]|jgi:UDP-N-acetylglucosamine--N-acetylmuramyl-(pentapeptide) pyrophosphoryl-undecaprenol N-acetylglucosamine transferase|nr:undecaprenyldiphospho-muramoylpentapeptide beta-N-acetylglucosaminyltransferase [Syntrophobacterales bacterium]
MKLFISAGGTGGHIFPGIAVAEAFTGLDRGNEAVFIGTPYGMESSIIPKRGFRILYIKAKQFLGQSALKKFSTLISVITGVFVAMAMIKREKPDAVLGMGGFTSVPVVLAAVILGVPSFIHEQNVQPGLANKILSWFVKWTFISFDETKSYLKTKRVSHTGNPMRKGLTKSGMAKDEKTFGIFVFGGSRGARSINEAIIAMLPYMENHHNVILYHQTGPQDFERIREAYGKSSVRHEIFPFTDTMEKYYGLSDVVISRAGASTIFELAFFKKAAIMIPYPYSAGGHQWKNAQCVENEGGGYVIADDEATGERLYEVALHLMREPGLIAKMGENIGKIYIEDSAERIIRGMFHGIS